MLTATLKAQNSLPCADSHASDRCEADAAAVPMNRARRIPIRRTSHAENIVAAMPMTKPKVLVTSAMWSSL